MITRIVLFLKFVMKFPAYWRDFVISHQSLRNDVSALEGRGLAALDELEQRLEARLVRQLMLNRLALRGQNERASKVEPIAGEFYRIEDKFDALRQLHPSAFEVWQQLFEAGRLEYERAPQQNLSVQGHADAEVFRAFIAPYMYGSILDVGCGPQALPVYLRGFQLDRVAGLDPLPGAAERRFEFRQGIAEFLPWADSQFDVVLFATSLDHVLSLEKTLEEVHRVLRPGGKCIVWAGLIPGSAPYRPDIEPVKAVDEYHLFHLSEETLIAAFASRFELLEGVVHAKMHGFYVFARSVDL
jgi:SAM-dependent methyltransferase